MLHHLKATDPDYLDKIYDGPYVHKEKENVHKDSCLSEEKRLNIQQRSQNKSG